MKDYKMQSQKIQGSAKLNTVRATQRSEPGFLHPALQLQHRLGNQAVQRLLNSNRIQAKGMPGHATHVSDVPESSFDLLHGGGQQLSKSVARVPGIENVHNTQHTSTGTRQILQRAYSPNEEDDFMSAAAPRFLHISSFAGTAGIQREPDSCDVPRSMNKNISGPYLNGLSAYDYMPDARGQRNWPSPTVAGTFDTGNRVGSKVQLYGVIPSPCAPSQYHLEQTVHDVRDRRNGVASPLEGTTFNDIARSGRDGDSAPFRRDFLGGGAHPLGYIISMNDPISTTYGSTTNREWDVDLTTSLRGPGGRKSVNWSISVRIVNGSVTRNTVT